VAPSEPLSPVERLFMEAGRSRISYGIWRAVTLPSLKINATVSSVLGGWPAEDLDDEETELKLARRWLEAEARKRDAKEDKPVPHAADASAVPLGPLMTTRQVREVLEEEKEAGRHITPEAFERALRRAARKARINPELLPLSLGGQHADWWLVELGPKKGGHGGGHKLRRRES